MLPESQIVSQLQAELEQFRGEDMEIETNSKNMETETNNKETATDTGPQVEAEETKQDLSLYPTANELPERPRRAIHCNFSHFFAIDFTKEGHDQYIYRHNNGLCVIGLASTHVALEKSSRITAIDFNVGKQSRTEMKATGKRKNNAYVLEPTSALCKVVFDDDTSYIIRCCVRGALLEVNERLISYPSLLRSKPESEGYIAILMPRPADWNKAAATFLTAEEYALRRSIKQAPVVDS